MNSFDKAVNLVGHAHPAEFAQELKDKGITSVGIYMRDDRSSKEEIDGLHSVDIKVWGVYEKGDPTGSGYFTPQQGIEDATHACDFADKVKWPKTAPIGFAVDYDVDPADLPKILNYFKAARAKVIDRKYRLVTVYGSGLVCRYIIDRGYAHYSWLAQSHGWANWQAYKFFCDIQQGPETTIEVGGKQIDIDSNIVNRPAMLW